MLNIPAGVESGQTMHVPGQGQKEVLSMDKPPALPKFQPEYLRGVNLFPADWTLSDTFEEYNKIYREIFWGSKN